MKAQKIFWKKETKIEAKTFNEFFVNIVKSFVINENLPPTSSSETRNVESIIAKFENHPSIVTIRNRIDKNSQRRIQLFKEVSQKFGKICL